MYTLYYTKNILHSTDMVTQYTIAAAGSEVHNTSKC